MAWKDDADRQEQQRRIDASIARASACHMSDAKWRKLFAAWRGAAIGALRWKFIRDDRVFVQSVPPPDAILEKTLGDVLPYPYGPYREIEWVEASNEDAERAANCLNAIGQFPLDHSSSGLRV